MLGKGVKQDSSKAMYFYLKAAEQDSAESQYSLACCYFNEFSEPEYQELGHSWLKKAADQGHEGAIEMMNELSSDS